MLCKANRTFRQICCINESVRALVRECVRGCVLKMATTVSISETMMVMILSMPVMAIAVSW